MRGKLPVASPTLGFRVKFHASGRSVKVVPCFYPPSRDIMINIVHIFDIGVHQFRIQIIHTGDSRNRFRLESVERQTGTWTFE
jgi:hypothetical protein